jgi:hypothetical protein
MKELQQAVGVYPRSCACCVPLPGLIGKRRSGSFEIAEQRQGTFTTKQAKAAGFGENTYPCHGRVYIATVRPLEFWYRTRLVQTRDGEIPANLQCDDDQIQNRA